MRLPLALNAAAAVLAIALGGIYVSHQDWDGVLVCVVLEAALLQAMSYQRSEK